MTQGAETTLYAALSTELSDVSGLYLEDSAIKKPSKAARDTNEQEHLWELTHDLLDEWLTLKDAEQYQDAVQ